MELSKTQLAGLAYALALAADDQENYLDNPNHVTNDYAPDDLRSKADSLKECAEAAYAIGQSALGERFENLSDEFRKLADPATGTPAPNPTEPNQALVKALEFQRRDPEGYERFLKEQAERDLADL